MLWTGIELVYLRLSHGDFLAATRRVFSGQGCRRYVTRLLRERCRGWLNQDFVYIDERMTTAPVHTAVSTFTENEKHHSYHTNKLKVFCNTAQGNGKNTAYQNTMKKPPELAFKGGLQHFLNV